MFVFNSVVGKLWLTIIGLVALVLMVLGFFLLQYIDMNFANSFDVKRLFIYTGIVGFLLTTFFAFFLSSRITKPLIQLKDAAESIASGDYTTKVSLNSNDEIGKLGTTFNYMAGQLEETIMDLKHEKGQLSSVLRSMTDAVITFNVEGQMILTNPQADKLIKEWHAISWNKEIIGEIPEPLLAVYERVLDETRELHTRLNVHDGVWSVVMNPLYVEGTIRGVVAVLRDVTEEYRLEKLRTDFVSNVSHDLRTPLSMLQGYSEALIDNMAGTIEERQELAQVILDESLRMGRMVQNLLELARMDAGHMEMLCLEVDMSTLAQRVVRNFSAMAKDQGVELELKLHSPDLRIYCGDEDRLEQVFTNLLENALRYSCDGSKIEIIGSLHHDHEPGGDHNERQAAVQFEIKDYGEGIAPEDLKYIFERFYKADKARTRGGSGGGTGLGLSIVKNIVEAHSGSVSVDSELGSGTTFIFMIPCRIDKKA